MRRPSITQLDGDDHAVPVKPAALIATLHPIDRAAATCAHCVAWDSAPPDDSWIPEDINDPEDPDGPRFVSEQDQWDAELDDLLGRNRYSRVEDREWEEWHGVDQDEAEREMLRLDAPAWVFLPPGGELAVALEDTRPQVMSPIALIELAKAATREAGWVEALKVEAIASFCRQREAEHAASPRLAQIDASGRPIDPERSWYAEIALALGLSPQTVARWVATALRLTGPLSATHTALKCGAFTWGKALAISEATADLSDEAAQAVEAHVLKRAASQTHANLLRSLRTQVAKHRTAEEAEEHRAAAAERTCKIVPLANGMAGLWIVHTADKIQQMWVTIQAVAALAKRHTPEQQPPTTPHTPNPATQTPANTASADTAPADTAPTDTTRGHTTSPGTTNGDAASTGTTSRDTTATPRGATTTSTDAAGDSCGDTTRTDTAAGTTRGDPTSTGTAGGTRPTEAPGDTTPPEAPDVGPATTPLDARPDPGKADTTHTDTPAGGAGKDTRTAEQRRADVTADLFEHILHNGLDWLDRRLPDQHRRRPHIEVVVPASTLLGLDDDPAELTGYGPIPAEMARRIAGDGTWRRLLTDPVNGRVLEASTSRHDPGTLITETLLARHPVCAWPGCNQSSRDCDRDHTTPFAQSGTTSLTGLAPYCEYHHVVKDTPAWGWTSTSHPDGSITLTTPTGHRYTTVPPARGPTTQPRSTDAGRHAGSKHALNQTSTTTVSRGATADDQPPF